MATGLNNKTLPNGTPVTVDHMDWPLYFCNVKGQLGENVWDKLPAPPTGGKKAGEGVTVVHPDTGYTKHPELLKSEERGFPRLDVALSKNFLEPDSPALDPLDGLHKNHGSATASVLMSEPGHPNDPVFGTPEFPAYTVPPQFYVTGIAPKAKLIPCRVTDAVVLFGDAVEALTKAIHYAVDLSRTDLTIGVISISLGCFPKHTLAEAIALAKDHGIVICAAAGQHKSEFPYPPGAYKPGVATHFHIGPGYPGHDKNVICVAACDSVHTMLYTGFYGENVAITAPGVDIWRSLSEKAADGTITFKVDQSFGSSYATPLVAGACALWQAHHGRANLIVKYGLPLIFDLFRWALFTSCYTFENTWDTVLHGRGVLDVEELLKLPLTITKSELQAWAASN